MIKADNTVAFETKYIACSVLILSVLMQAVFLIINKWDLTVLFANFLSGFVSVLNFFLMGITVQNAITTDKKKAHSKIKLSQSLRTLLLFAVAAFGCILPCFNTAALLIPFFFPRIAIALRPVIKK